MSPSRRTSTLICSAECGRRDGSYEGIGDSHAAIKAYGNLSDASVQASWERRAFTGEKRSALGPFTEVDRPSWEVRSAPVNGHDRSRCARAKSAQEGTFGQTAFLHLRTDRNANCAGPRLPPEVHRLKERGKTIKAFPLSWRAVLDVFRVQCSASRSGDPIVAGKRPNYYAINYPELQARIEIAHRPLIEVNDAARR